MDETPAESRSGQRDRLEEQDVTDQARSLEETRGAAAAGTRSDTGVHGRTAPPPGGVGTPRRGVPGTMTAASTETGVEPEGRVSQGGSGAGAHPVVEADPSHEGSAQDVDVRNDQGPPHDGRR